MDNGSAGDGEHLKRVMKLCETFNLVQVIHMPIRDNNSLDLLFTKDMVLFTDTEVIKTSTHFPRFAQVHLL